jgi:hypothetical protein
MTEQPVSPLHRCPCCHSVTLTERGAFEICPVCNWEDDGQGDNDAYEVREGPNGWLSLTDARRNFLAQLSPLVVARVVLTEAHKSTGRTRHLIGDLPMPRPSELRVVRDAEGHGLYLFYCDAAGTEMTDTFHQTLDEAFSQAEFEFQVRPDEWTQVGSGPVAAWSFRIEAPFMLIAGLTFVVQ